MGASYGPRQCVRRSRRASLAPRWSLHSLSAHFAIDDIGKMSINQRLPNASALSTRRVRRDIAVCRTPWPFVKRVRFARWPESFDGRRRSIRGPGSRDSRRGGLSRRLRLRKGPRAVQDLALRAIEANQIVPSGRRRQAVRDLAVAAAELDGERSVVAGLRGQVVERIGVLGIGREIALGVIDADRPEAVDRERS